MLWKRSEREGFTGSLGQTDRLTLCTELNLASQTPSSGGLANPGRVGAALRSLGNCRGRGGEGVPQAAMLFCYSLCQICCCKTTQIVLKKIQLSHFVELSGMAVACA